MHLRDRRRRHRTLVEGLEENFQRLAQPLFDQLACDAAVEGRQAILQIREIGGEALAEQIGAGREALAELDEARTQRLQRARQALARPSRRRLVGKTPAELRHDARAAAASR